MKLTSIQKLLAAVVLIVLAVVLVVVLVIVPKFGELSQLASDKQAAEQEVARTLTVLAQLQQAKSGAALTQAELLRIANEFPESPDLPSLIIELQDVSNAAGVRFNRVSPGQPTAPPSSRYTEVPVTVSLVGRWSDVIDYLRRVNHMTRAIRVTDVALAPTTQSSVAPTSAQAPDLTADLSLKAYVMSSAAAIPPGGASTAATSTPAAAQ